MQFSIITPVYNAERYLRQTIESVLAQTCTDWEMVCTDDGSQDASGAILDEYAAKDTRIKVIHQANGGEGAARNAALKVARGDWWVFLDADDLLTPWALKSYAACAERHPAAEMVGLGLCEFKGDGTPEIGALVSEDKHNPIVIDVSKCLSPNTTLQFFVQYAYRRDVVGDQLYTDHYVGADRVFLFGCLLNATTVACDSPTAYQYRRIPTSVTCSRMSLRKVRDGMRYVQDIFKSIEKSRKRLALSAQRELVGHLLECTVFDIYRLVPNDRGAAWRDWFAMLMWLNGIPRGTRWQRMVARVCAYGRFDFLHIIPFLLCWLPLKLKLLGIHR